MAERGRGGIVVCSSLAAMQGIYNRGDLRRGEGFEMLLGEGLWAELFPARRRSSIVHDRQHLHAQLHPCPEDEKHGFR